MFKRSEWEDAGAGAANRQWQPRDVRLLVGLAAWVATFAIFFVAPATAQQPHKGLVRKLAVQGSLFEKEHQNYAYRRSFQFFEMDPRGKRVGSYREVRDVLFTPDGRRIEEFVGHPDSRLKRIRLTDEDFRDLREVQPFVLTNETLWRYKLTYKGPETVDGEDCYVYRLKPRQVFENDRLLDGLIWVSRQHEQILRVAGRPVPQIHGTTKENLFPQFTTLYQAVDGRFWFPVKTVASDILPFAAGTQRVHYVILYEDYRRFTTESTITFEAPSEP